MNVDKTMYIYLPRPANPVVFVQGVRIFLAICFGLIALTGDESAYIQIATRKCSEI